MRRGRERETPQDAERDDDPRDQARRRGAAYHDNFAFNSRERDGGHARRPIRHAPSSRKIQACTPRRPRELDARVGAADDDRLRDSLGPPRVARGGDDRGDAGACRIAGRRIDEVVVARGRRASSARMRVVLVTIAPSHSGKRNATRCSSNGSSTGMSHAPSGGGSPRARRSPPMLDEHACARRGRRGRARRGRRRDPCRRRRGRGACPAGRDARRVLVDLDAREARRAGAVRRRVAVGASAATSSNVRSYPARSSASRIVGSKRPAVARCRSAAHVSASRASG